ncbi:hypothetical protein D3C76_1517420 [compost metagenome]
MPRLQVLAGAGVENHLVQRAPCLFDLLGNLCHLPGLVEITHRQQHLVRKPCGQCRQAVSPACAQGDLVTLLQQAQRQGRADTAAGTGQPATAHASLPLSQRIAPPITGTCS